jgi:hypothetical protein
VRHLERVKESSLENGQIGECASQPWFNVLFCQGNLPQRLVSPLRNPGMRRISAAKFGMFFCKTLHKRSTNRPQNRPQITPQNRHPERSASQIFRMTGALLRGVEGPRDACWQTISRAFLMTNSGVHLFMHAYHLPSPSFCKVFELGINRANKVELLFATPAFELFFPSYGFAKRPQTAQSRAGAWQ